MTSNILVVGAGGFLGTHICKALVEAGHDVVGLDPFQPDGIEFAEFYAAASSDMESFKKAVTGCNSVIYLGGHIRPGSEIARMSEELGRETGHVLDLAEICRDSGVSRFVAVSSGGTVYGKPVDDAPMSEDHPTNPISVYGYTRLAMEHGLRLIDKPDAMSTVVLRLANPYGPGQRVRQSQGLIPAIVGALYSNKPVQIWGDGLAVRDFIYVSDVAKAFVRAVEVKKCPQLLNIGSGQGHSVLEICDAIRDTVGKPFDIVHHPARSVDVPYAVLSIERACEALDWQPTFALTQGIEQFLSWYEATLNLESNANGR